MRSAVVAVAASAILLAGLAVAGDGSGLRPTLSGSLLLGYSGGAGGEAGLIVSHIAPSFPFAARIGIGYLKTDPGKPTEARVNFINDATNGTPEESGHIWDFSLDFMYPLSVLDQRRIYAIAGPRYSRFTGTFTYVGGNEKFDVTSNQWGFGAGIETFFSIGARTELILAAGLDNYFSSTLSGHDTSYSPDGESVNGRKGFDYGTADKAINQPKIEARLMMGFAYEF